MGVGGLCTRSRSTLQGLQTDRLILDRAAPSHCCSSKSNRCVTLGGFGSTNGLGPLSCRCIRAPSSSPWRGPRALNGCHRLPMSPPGSCACKRPFSRAGVAPAPRRGVPDSCRHSWTLAPVDSIARVSPMERQRRSTFSMDSQMSWCCCETIPVECAVCATPSSQVSCAKNNSTRGKWRRGRCGKNANQASRAARALSVPAVLSVEGHLVRNGPLALKGHFPMRRYAGVRAADGTSVGRYTLHTPSQSAAGGACRNCSQRWA